ncbi:hypothetical protein TRFO_00837 [Tritrichomonas foetus]|uniref:Uncharacterized protein n=1 Tax=Tritrichomonas foetus TaxID=1144522 RepID=A0A1J4L2E2_9EUKA|nr:hypothetical protein TRFO_00837 [Tritrichomonas foetus]|eukprot:OHT17586.1 hypothetical protein TRFO_00837 [Tritrichomonas foetus]
MINSYFEGFSATPLNPCTLFELSSSLFSQQSHLDQKQTLQLEHTIKEVLIPNICYCIQNLQADEFSFIPQITEMLIEVFDDEAIEYINDFIFPTILSVYSMLSNTNNINIHHKTRETLVDLIVAILNSIPKDFFDTCLVKLIQQLVKAPEYYYRILALKLFPLAHFRQFVKKNFDKLFYDENIKVRLAAIENLNIMPINQLDKEEYLLKAILDSNQTFYNHVSAHMSIISSTNVGLYNEMLKNKPTMANAILDSPRFVQANGFCAIKEAFTNAIVMMPNEGVQALIKLSAIIEEDERQSLFECSLKISNFVGFMTNLYKFAQYFPNKDIFINLLSMEGVEQWRMRKILIDQCILFASHLHQKLIPIALSFSCDEIACIRNQTVELWIRIINACPECTHSIFDQLLSKSWQQRLIAAKIVSKLGMSHQTEDVARTLCNDAVSNVRYYMACFLAETPYFIKYFETSSDPDVAMLRQ